ncbi:MAG: response regulator [Chitinispirillales bacterium]|jgi:signal transduction histidine kinase/PAS domain-containing protein/ActR/RegA family two-component response regulator|nr:response regulator [Chitinispirillales bacterium]
MPKNANPNSDMRDLLNELVRLIEASLSGDYGIILDDGGLSGDAARVIRILNMVIGNYRDSMEYDLMKYKLTSDALGIALWDLDIVSTDPLNLNNFFIWSQEFRHLLGFTDSSDFPDLLSSWSDRLHPDDKERTLTAFAAHIADRSGKTPYNLEYRLLTKNNEYRYYHAFGATFRDADGLPIRTAGALEDIEEKKRLEEAFEYREKMLDSLNKMAVLLTSHADESLADVLGAGLNPIAGVAGIDRIAVYRRFDNDGTGVKIGQIYLWHSETIPLDKELISLPIIQPTLRWLEIFERGGCVNADVSDMSEDAAEFLSQFGVKAIFMVPIFVRGELWGVVTLEDHTDHRYFEESNLDLLRSAAHLCAGAIVRSEMEREVNDASEKLRKALREANAANRAKSDFLSNMSHEMRTPLNAIIGMTAICKKEKDVERKNHTLNKIELASLHLLGVINDVLDMAKIEANKLELTIVEYDFEKMLQKALTVVNYKVDEKRQRFTVNLDDSIPRFIIGDDQRLSQVITNLLSNAVKFTPEGGDISLSMSLACEKNEVCTLRIEVADNGIGISPGAQTKLFHAFEQAGSGISRQYGGTGLGLAISKRIVELMDGEIWVESEHGKGATFIFVVKVRRGASMDGGSEERRGADDADAGTVVAGEFSGKIMLLAEDIEINREIIISILEDTGIAIECAENGKVAMEMVRADPNRYDIVFMDLQMPVMDGLAATRCIRLLPERSRGKLPIVAMTANVFKSDIEACTEAGMDAHLGKPLDVDRMLETLRRYLGN